MPHAWDAGQYLRFADERTRPAIDLLARLDLAPRRIVDLGCGPGNSTALLRRRWPDAALTGLDNSPEMLEAARQEHPGIDFILNDIAEWSPDEPCDLVFSNAALQWVGDHERLLPRLVAAVAPGGALAVQMPSNQDFLTHRLMRQAAAESAWANRLADARPPSPVKPIEFYFDCLAPLCARITLWETNYLQIMDSVDSIIAWLRGTGLAPFLSRLGPAEQPLFVERYKALLAAAMPQHAGGKLLLPYPRLFFIATPR